MNSQSSITAADTGLTPREIVAALDRPIVGPHSEARINRSPCQALQQAGPFVGACLQKFGEITLGQQNTPQKPIVVKTEQLLDLFLRFTLSSIVSPAKFILKMKYSALKTGTCFVPFDELLQCHLL
jgi:hypothetical protein